MCDEVALARSLGALSDGARHGDRAARSRAPRRSMGRRRLGHADRRRQRRQSRQPIARDRVDFVGQLDRRFVERRWHFVRSLVDAAEHYLGQRHRRRPVARARRDLERIGRSSERRDGGGRPAAGAGSPREGGAGRRSGCVHRFGRARRTFHDAEHRARRHGSFGRHGHHGSASFDHGADGVRRCPSRHVGRGSGAGSLCFGRGRARAEPAEHASFADDDRDGACARSGCGSEEPRRRCEAWRGRGRFVRSALRPSRWPSGGRAVRSQRRAAWTTTHRGRRSSDAKLSLGA